MSLKISDVTLRDGSYVTNFSFTAEFTMEMTGLKAEPTFGLAESSRSRHVKCATRNAVLQSCREVRKIPRLVRKPIDG